MLLSPVCGAVSVQVDACLSVPLLCLCCCCRCDEDFRGEITTWALGLLDALASPHLLHLGAHIANCLSKPIAWREQLQKDGVRVGAAASFAADASSVAVAPVAVAGAAAVGGLHGSSGC